MSTVEDFPNATGVPDAERYGPRSAPSRFELGTDGPRLILVGADGSRTSLRAAAYACGPAQRQGCQLVFAYAVPLGGWGWAIPGVGPVLQRTLDELESVLRNEVRQLAEDAQVPVAFVSRRGDPYPCLCAIADEVRADIVVVGASSQVRRLFGGSVGGSVGGRLIRRGHWPITVVP